MTVIKTLQAEVQTVPAAKLKLKLSLAKAKPTAFCTGFARCQAAGLDPHPVRAQVLLAWTQPASPAANP